jgi:hypothetical protein
LEENRFLQQHRRVPAAPLLERKRALAGELDTALAALRAAPRGDSRLPEVKAALDQTRSRILQTLQIEKESEELLLRLSLSGSAGLTAAPTASPGMLQKIYSRHQS